MDGGEGTDGVVPEGGQQFPICNRFISAWSRLCPEIWGISVTLGSEFKGLGLEQAKILLGCPEAPVSIAVASRTFLPQATAAGPPDKLD